MVSYKRWLRDDDQVLAHIFPQGVPKEDAAIKTTEFIKACEQFIADAKPYLDKQT